MTTSKPNISSQTKGPDPSRWRLGARTRLQPLVFLAGPPSGYRGSHPVWFDRADARPMPPRGCASSPTDKHD
ncbi:unnamed protein product [Pieris macdunnoughi]|uniref:Uncharacterized protein n=1 Tax=Pieris macdunnoughi TaxID=345717 RepID=A0A821X3A7_9NEOP|nr:unnamed protein product [Pieris macdunnoughi]